MTELEYTKDRLELVNLIESVIWVREDESVQTNLEAVRARLLERIKTLEQ